MKDFSIIKLEDDDKITMGLGEDSSLYQTENPSQRLLQKIIVALKQDPGSNFFHTDGYSLKAVIGKKSSPSDIEDMKVQIYYTIDKLQKSLIAEQEIASDPDPEGMLDRIIIVDIEVDENAQAWAIGLIIFDQAGNKTYLRV